MRRYIVFVLLLAMTGALGYLLVTRPRTPHESQLGEPAQDGGVARGAAAASKRTDGGRPRAGAFLGNRVDAGPPALLGRPLRVVALGWDELTPGVLANNGASAGAQSAFHRSGVDVTFSAASNMASIERALARGGSSQDGADIAILSLPRFVAAYERLRALTPEIFFVVGWSRGREALTATPPATLAHLPPTGDVQLVAARGEPPALLALFLFDASGVAPSRVRLVDPSEMAAATAAYAAIDRSKSDAANATGSRAVLVSTSDATGLIPIVAIAPQGFVEGQPDTAAIFARTWLDGATRLRRDVPEAARQVAAVRGAPEAVELLQLLGQSELATLRDNAQLAALSGRGAVTLDALFVRTWRLYRDAGVLSSPTPARAPLSTATIARLVRTDPSLAAPARSTAPSLSADAASRQPATLTMRLDARDTQRLVAELGFMADVFGRSPIRVLVGSSRTRTTQVIQAAVQRFDLEPARIVPGRRPVGGASASIEVLAAP